MKSKLYKIYELNDEVDLEHHHLHYKLLTTFELPSPGIIQGSASGLLLLRDLSLKPNGLSICNPVTREYIEIHSPEDFDYKYPQKVTFGFGTSVKTNQHKLVRVFHDCINDEDTTKVLGITKSECHVYTVGAGSWRSVAPSPPFVYSCRSTGAFLNGNLHWIVFDLDGKPTISSFDLETEMFRVFSPPRNLGVGGRLLIQVFALGDSLCVSDNSSDDEIVIWLMKEYGDEKSWRKEYVIRKSEEYEGEWYELVRPIKVFRNDDVLMSWGDFFLFYSSSKSRTMSEIEMFSPGVGASVDAVLHTSSLLSLRSFGVENVSYL